MSAIRLLRQRKLSGVIHKSRSSLTKEAIFTETKTGCLRRLKVYTQNLQEKYTDEFINQLLEPHFEAIEALKKKGSVGTLQLEVVRKLIWEMYKLWRIDCFQVIRGRNS